MATSAGVATNADYTWWGNVDNLVSALRVHRVSAAGFEENISLIAFAKCYYHLHAALGSTDRYPLYDVGRRYDSGGKARRSIIRWSAGLHIHRGAYGRAVLTVA